MHIWHLVLYPSTRIRVLKRDKPRSDGGKGSVLYPSTRIRVLKREHPDLLQELLAGSLSFDSHQSTET